MKLSKIIAAHLESNKRLVVPQLGAFIVKESAGREVIFSELLRRDDGVFRSLLVQQGMGELEAAAAIDRFVFDIRHALQHGTPFILEGLGALLYGPDNAIVFKYVPTSHMADIRAMAAREVRQETIPEPTVSRSATAQPDKHVRGLRYNNKTRQRTVRYAPGGKPVRRKRGVDKFLLLAILAAAIAVAVMIYGYFMERRKAAFEAEMNLTETALSAESGFGQTDTAQQSADGEQL